MTFDVNAPPPDRPVPVSTLTVLGTAPDTLATEMLIATLAAAVSLP